MFCHSNFLCQTHKIFTPNDPKKQADLSKVGKLQGLSVVSEVAKLSTDDFGIRLIPIVVTDCPPLPLHQDLHPPLVRDGPAHKTDRRRALLRTCTSKLSVNYCTRSVNSLVKLLYSHLEHYSMYFLAISCIFLVIPCILSVISHRCTSPRRWCCCYSTTAECMESIGTQCSWRSEPRCHSNRCMQPQSIVHCRQNMS